MKKILFIIFLLASTNMATYYFAYNKGYEEGGSISGILDSGKKAMSDIDINPCKESTSDLCSSVNDSLDKLSEFFEEK